MAAAIEERGMSIQAGRADRRVRRTRRQLRDALMALILERGYNAVTIEDITDRADLGRTTFYLHFRDKEDLLVASLEEIAEDLKAQVEEIADDDVVKGGVQMNPVAVVFRHVDENRDLYRIILQGEGSNKAASRIRDIIEEAAADYFARRLSALVSAPPEVPRGLVAGYFAAAMMGFVTLWLEKELPFRGDEAADLFMTLFFRGAARVLNLTIEG
jgi:AcrR family transcriptional regulator